MQKEKLVRISAIAGAGFCLAAVLGIAWYRANGQEKRILNTRTDKVSYAFGADLGNSLRHRSVVIDPELFSRGLRDGLAGGKTLLTPEEVRAAIAGVQNEQKLKLLAKNKREGDRFLAANKARPEVVTLASGLQYKILKPGAGRKPSAGATVVCNYRVSGLDGTEIDSSYARNQPVTFPVKAAIRGWAEALQLMPAGSKWQLFVPPDLATVAGKESPSNATVIIEVELVAIQEPT